MSKLFSKIFQFYIYSNLHVSLVVLCYVCVTGMLFDVEVLDKAVVLSCSTFVAYHLIRYLNRVKYGKTHLLDEFSNRNKIPISILVLLAFIIIVFITLKFSLQEILRLWPVTVLTLFYAVSVFKINGKTYSIRYFIGIKIFIIALAWAWGVVLFPLGYGFNVLIYFIEVVLFVIVLTLPFDIRDMLFDKKTVKTLPMIMGVGKVKVLGALLLLFSLILHFNFFTYRSFLAYVITCVLLLILLLKAKGNQTKYFASFWVESIPIIYFIMLKLMI